MTTSVVYSPKAAQALAYLKSFHNDIEIFVEDQSIPNLWVKLLRNYLPENVRLTSVNVLGSKQEVLKACRADQQDDGRKKLYIVDGDLDLLRGKAKPRLKHLYRLRAYSVENYLLDKESIVEAVTTLAPRLDEQTVMNQLDLDGWFERNRELLTSLFVCYAASFELNREASTVKFSVHKLLRSGDAHFDFCSTKIVSRIVGLYRRIRQNRSRGETRLAYNRIDGNAAKLGVERFVSGKDYLFPIVFRKVTTKFRVTTKADSLKTLIAKCTVSIQDPYLLRRVRQICK